MEKIAQFHDDEDSLVLAVEIASIWLKTFGGKIEITGRFVSVCSVDHCILSPNTGEVTRNIVDKCIITIFYKERA